MPSGISAIISPICTFTDEFISGKVVEVVQKLNKVIHDDKSLGAGFEVGHSYFCFEEPDKISDDTINDIVRFEIIPTIEEYWFDNESRLKEEREKLNTLIDDDNAAV